MRVGEDMSLGRQALWAGGLALAAILGMHLVFGGAEAHEARERYEAMRSGRYGRRKKSWRDKVPGGRRCVVKARDYFKGPVRGDVLVRKTERIKLRRGCPPTPPRKLERLIEMGKNFVVRPRAKRLMANG